jgi:hypothetical protein
MGGRETSSSVFLRPAITSPDVPRKFLDDNHLPNTLFQKPLVLGSTTLAMALWLTSEKKKVDKEGTEKRKK